MEKLDKSQIRFFQGALKERMKMTGHTDLFHTVGFLCQMEELGGEIFVDQKNGEKASLICATFGDLQHLLPGHTDKEIPSVNYISLHVWCESVEQLNWANLKEFLDSTLTKNNDRTFCNHYRLLAVNGKLLNALQRYEGFKWKMTDIVKANLASNLDQSDFPAYPCPDGFNIKPLTHDDTLFVLGNYKHSESPSVRRRLLGLSSIGKSRGVFNDKTGELVSWAFLNWDSSISVLFTLDEWRCKGLGLAVVSSLIEMCKSKGYPVFSMIQIEAGSERPKQFFSRFRFECFEDVIAWCELSA